MSWDYSVSDQALKQLRKMGAQGRKRIFAYLDSNITGCEDPRAFGKALRGELGEFWRYRTITIASSAKFRMRRWWSSW